MSWKMGWADISRSLAIVVPLMLGTMMVSDGLAQTASTLEGLLQQLDQLQQEGALGPLLEDRPSPVDNARQRALQAREAASIGVEKLREGELIGGFTPGERLLIQAHCEGNATEADRELLPLVPRFSPLEQDYCARAGEVVLQFGYDLFEGFGGLKELTTGAIRDDYVLGIGDEFVVTFQGQQSRTVTTRVDREGRLVFPNLGPIPSLGRSFGTVRSDIEGRTASAMLGTTVFVSLGSVRELSVIVAGEVAAPGAYQLTGLSTVLDALGQAGGIRKTGSLRRIQVQRADRIFWIDAYDLLLGGAATTDLSLFDGDYIVVPPIGPTVALAGRAKRTGIYEMPEGASTISLHDVLEFAGGALRPRGNRFVHITFDDLGSEQVAELRDTGISLRDGDIVIVNRAENVQIGAVDLVGHVRVPGSRPLVSAPTAGALLGNATSLGKNPYVLFAAIESTDPATQSRRLFPINLLRVLAAQQDFKLRDRDRLIVLSNEDVRFLTSRDVQNTILGLGLDGRRRPEQEGGDAGARRNTDAIGRNGTPSVTDLLASIRSGNQEKTAEPTPPGPESAEEPLGPVCLGLQRLAALVAESRPGRFSTAIRAVGSEPRDMDFVPAVCPDIYENYPDLLPLALEHVAAVNGEVRSPGAYPVLPETPLSHILAVVGGTTREADLSRIEVLRGSADGQATRDLIDLARVNANTVSLGPGDSIRFNQVFTNRDTGPVEIAGEVVRPGFYQIRRGERLSELVERAGGLTPQAYPYGAIFTRERVREAQQIGFKRAARELNASLAVAAAQGDVNPNALLAFFELTRDLSSAEAIGRVVIEADPTVLQVRPELDSVLEPGDKLFVPKRPNSVLVIGDVLSPGALQFISGTKVDRYISQAGGFQRSADEDRVFVVYPNGEAQPVSVSVWNYTPVQVPPGSTIVVPKDPAPINLFQITKEFAQVVSQLAITAASLAVIGNN